MNRGWTLIVLADPGQSAKRFYVPRRLIVLAVFLILSMGIALGLWLSKFWGSASGRGAEYGMLSTPWTLKNMVPMGIKMASAAVTNIFVPVETQCVWADEARNIPLPQTPFLLPKTLVLQKLKLLNVASNEFLELQPFRNSREQNAHVFSAIQYLMRCHHTGKTKPVAPELVALLVRIANLYPGRVIQLVSGYRNPRDGQTSPNSYHTRGMAVDIRIPGVNLETLWKQAIQLGAGGVGLYTQSAFVHVDVRQTPYQWKELETVEEGFAEEETAENE